MKHIQFCAMIDFTTLLATELRIMFQDPRERLQTINVGIQNQMSKKLTVICEIMFWLSNRKRERRHLVNLASIRNNSALESVEGIVS